MDGRWTNGNAIIPASILRRSKFVHVDLAAAIAYPVEHYFPRRLRAPRGLP
jgi:hypothetical protein